ncbi:hypothetical protein AA313_de0209817 [Arthrobotrys entomopaga]|nr:hypothetical protein AA313_de0209817 [Arthrobotrys entomopaga]
MSSCERIFSFRILIWMEVERVLWECRRVWRRDSEAQSSWVCEASELSDDHVLVVVAAVMVLLAMVLAMRLSSSSGGRKCCCCLPAQRCLKRAKIPDSACPKWWWWHLAGGSQLRMMTMAEKTLLRMVMVGRWCYRCEET